MLTAGLSAQQWGTGFKFGGGPLRGRMSEDLGSAGFTFGGAFEVTRSLAKGSDLVFDLGYQSFPGDYKTMSFIPSPIPAAGTYEARVRKSSADGFFLNALYRSDFGLEDIYFQAGLRFARTKYSQTDTGSSLTYSTPTTLTRVDTIADNQERQKYSVGGVFGAGYHLTERYSLEANLFTTQMDTTVGTSSGWAAELLFRVKF
jgi:hypothetical protein